MEKQCLSLREIQMEELEILKNFIKYAEKRNLKYYLCGGTLIGAIRHQGFIPWDDDIDICMPRPDYDKLIMLAKKETILENYELKSMELKNSVYPFSKVVNKNIKIRSNSKEDKNLWIDIFPIDSVPDEKEKQEKLINEIMKYKGIMYLHNTKMKDILKENKSKKNKFLKILLKPISFLIPKKIVSKKMIKIAKSNDYNKGEKLGVYIWGYGIREIMDRKIFEKGIKVKFEDIEANAPAEYDKYLTNIYGDYMKLPPEEKRIIHNTVAFKD
ncbi:MAG TPA: LicD family protein [Clostridiaceae bacterium]|nr:LicD family protein [Clostridiaceae bacterium]